MAVDEGEDAILERVQDCIGRIAEAAETLHGAGAAAELDHQFPAVAAHRDVVLEHADRGQRRFAAGVQAQRRVRGHAQAGAAGPVGAGMGHGALGLEGLAVEDALLQEGAVLEQDDAGERQRLAVAGDQVRVGPEPLDSLHDAFFHIVRPVVGSPCRWLQQAGEERQAEGRQGGGRVAGAPSVHGEVLVAVTVREAGAYHAHPWELCRRCAGVGVLAGAIGL